MSKLLRWIRRHRTSRVMAAALCGVAWTWPQLWLLDHMELALPSAILFMAGALATDVVMEQREDA